MARFDVFNNPDASERAETPFFLDVQNDHIDGIESRVVIPLRTQHAFGPRARDLNPQIKVGEALLVLDTAALGAVPLNALRRSVMNLGAGRSEVQSALDTLFGSY